MDTITVDGYEVAFDLDQPEEQVSRFRVRVPKGLMEQALNRRLLSVTQNVKIPGFRPGHAPVALLRKQYGTQVFPEVVQAIVNHCNTAIFKKHNIVPAIDPQVKLEKAEMDSELSFDVEAVPLPELNLEPLNNITVERLQPSPSDDDLLETLKEIAEANRGSTALTANEKVMEDRIVVVDFSGAMNGKEVPNTKGTDVSIEIGAGRFIPEFEKALLGHKAGDTFTKPVMFPADYGSAVLAGKTVDFTITIKDVRRPNEATIDDALAKRLNLVSLDDLKTIVRSNIEQHMRQAIEDVEARHVLDSIHNVISFRLPPKMVELEFRSLLDELQRARSDGRLSKKEAAMSDDEQQKHLRQMAERRVKLAVVLTHVSRKHEIGITEQEWLAFVQTEAQRSRQNLENVRQHLARNPRLENAMRAALLERKLLRFLLERGKGATVNVTIADLRARQKDLDDDDHDHDHHHDHDHDHHHHHDHHGHDHHHDHHHHDHGHDHDSSGKKKATAAKKASAPAEKKSEGDASGVASKPKTSGGSKASSNTETTDKKRVSTDSATKTKKSAASDDSAAATTTKKKAAPKSSS